MKGYVINLKKRQDRLERFQNEIGKQLTDINIEVIEAVDGSTLDLTDPNLINDVSTLIRDFPDKILKGIIGCCLSHLKCYDIISKRDDKYAIIFEDDCWFRSEEHKKKANELIKQLDIPEKFGIIFLNKWDYGGVKIIKNIDKDLNTITGVPTTEAFIINKDYAKILYDENIHDIGAIDAHMGRYISKYPDYPTYNLVDELFIQRDRRDSDIR